MEEIYKTIPHRPPFLFIDRIIEVTETGGKIAVLGFASRPRVRSRGRRLWSSLHRLCEGESYREGPFETKPSIASLRGISNQ